MKGRKRFSKLILGATMLLGAAFMQCRGMSVQAAEQGKAETADLTEEVSAYAADGNEFEDAIEISTDMSVSGSIEERDEGDYYSFTLSQAGYVEVQFYHEPVDSSDELWTISLYNSQYEELVSRTSTGKTEDTSLPRVGLSAGTYYVKVTRGRYNWSDTPYKLTVRSTGATDWETEFNEGFETADEIVTDVAVNGSIMHRNDEDFYSFALSQTGYVEEQFYHEPVDSGNELWTISLYNSQYEELVSRTSTGKTEDALLPRVGLSAGTYYVKVTRGRYNWSDMPYKLTVRFTGATDWEMEFNEEYGAANKITTDVTVNGSIMHSNDEDFYSFTLSQAGYVEEQFYHEPVDSGSDLWTISLYNSQYEKLVSRTSTGKTEDVSLPKVGLAAGTYYVKVTKGRYDWSDTPYKLIVAFTGGADWESEWNNNFESANTLSVGNTVKGTIMEGDDSDYYKIRSNTSGELSFRFEHASLGNETEYWTIKVYDANYNEKSSHTSKGNDTTLTLNGGYISSGTDCYIRVSSGRYYYSSIPYKLTALDGFALQYPSLTVKVSGGNKVKLTWTQVSGADGYEIYRSATGWYDGFKKIKTVTGEGVSSDTDKNVTGGATYYYKVIAYKNSSGGKTYSDYSAVEYAKINLVRVKLVKAASPSRKKVSLTWKKVNGASGYEVYRAVSKNGTYRKAKTVVSGSKVSYVGKLKSGKTYYFKVRAYRKTGSGKVYGSFSTIKAVKIK